MKKAAGYFVFVLIMVLMTAAVLTYLAPHLGWRVDAVCSGSMEPELKVGSVVVARSVEPEAIAAGDIITFHATGMDDTLISHRVVSIEKNSPLQFKTKGDANGIRDPFTVPASNVVGKVYLHVPYLGYVIQFLKTEPGFIFALVMPGLIITTMYGMSVWRVLTNRRRRKAEQVIRE